MLFCYLERKRCVELAARLEAGRATQGPCMAHSPENDAMNQLADADFSYHLQLE